jgi:hypothetical protein
MSSDSGATARTGPTAGAPDDLLRLIERLEQATEGGRGTDAEIYYCINLPHSEKWAGARRWHSMVPHYTTSIDAALTLVPDALSPIVMLGGVWADHHQRAGQDIWEAAVVKDTSDFEGTYIGDITGFSFYGRASNGALALCIAALKARAAVKVAVPAGPNGAVSPDPIDGGDRG